MTTSPMPPLAAGAVQSALIQATAPPTTATSTPGPLTVSNTVPMPALPPPPGHVIIRVLAVALNPNDFKVPTYMPSPGATAGCDYCGSVVAASAGDDSHDLKEGDRICGFVYGYNPARPLDGAFAQFAVVDARLALRVPATWTDTQAAGLGGIGWTTAALSMWGPDMLALKGRPSSPVTGAESEPVLVYGGATASGTMASQLLKLSGYKPIAIASPASASLAKKYGAVGTASYLSASVVEDARQAATAAAGDGGKQIRYVIDCITNVESYAASMQIIARRGGRYTCLEAIDSSWLGGRKAVKATVVMAYETRGYTIDYGMESPYTRLASPESHALGVEATKEVQACISNGRIVPHPVRELQGGWDGIIKGLEMLKGGKVSGEKLVVKIPQAL